MSIILSGKRKSKTRDWRVLYVRPDGQEGKKLYLNACDGFTQDKAGARVFRQEHEWKQVMREFARMKIFLTVDPYNFEPELSDRNAMDGE